jgi:hypothetical protein
MKYAAKIGRINLAGVPLRLLLKNKNAGIWGRGEDHVFKGMKLADNGVGYTHAYPDRGIYTFAVLSDPSKTASPSRYK